MVTEFGVPSGLGAAHRGPLGRDQGDHSEQEAGRIDAAMLRAIQRDGLRRRPAVRVRPTSGSSAAGTRRTSRSRSTAVRCGTTC